MNATTCYILDVESIYLIITSISTGCSSSSGSSYNRLEGCRHGRTLQVAVNASSFVDPNMASSIPRGNGEEQQQAEQRKGKESILSMFLFLTSKYIDMLVNPMCCTVQQKVKGGSFS